MKESLYTKNRSELISLMLWQSNHKWLYLGLASSLQDAKSTRKFAVSYFSYVYCLDEKFHRVT